MDENERNPLRTSAYNRSVTYDLLWFVVWLHMLLPPSSFVFHVPGITRKAARHCSYVRVAAYAFSSLNTKSLA